MQPRMMVQKVWNCRSVFALSLCFCFNEMTIVSSPVDLSGVPSHSVNWGFHCSTHGRAERTQTPPSAKPFHLLGVCSIFPGGSACLCGDREIILGFICGGFKKANSKLCETTLGDNNLQQMSQLFNVRLTREPSEIINAYMCLLVRQTAFSYYFSWISLPDILTYVLPRSDIPIIPCKNQRNKPKIMENSTDCKTPQHTCITLNMHMKSRSEKSAFTPINSKCQRHQKNLHVSTVRLS